MDQRTSERLPHLTWLGSEQISGLGVTGFSRVTARTGLNVFRPACTIAEHRVPFESYPRMGGRRAHQTTRLHVLALAFCGEASLAKVNTNRQRNYRVVVLISANAEWRNVTPLFPNAQMEASPYGEFFVAEIGHEEILFFHGGWGKIAAAGSTQYVIDQFQPERLINLGTCGGVEGRIERFQVVAAERVIVYDIAEAMGDSKQALADYSTELSLPVQPPTPVIRVTMLSADKDLTSSGLKQLESICQPITADWESGAIAWIAQKNRKPVLILRGVTDLVGPHSAEAQENLALFEANTVRVMHDLIRDLPRWLEIWR